MTDPRALGGFATAVLFAITIWKLRRQDAISFGLAWFVLLLVPSAILVVLDRGEPMSEGRVYTACVGFFLSAGALASASSERAQGISRVAQHRARDIGYAIIIVLALRTMTRNVVWHGAVSCGSRPLRCSASLAAASGTRRSAARAGTSRRGDQQYRQALVLRPSEPLTYAKLGQCLLETGQMEAADVTFESLKVIDPGSSAAATGLGLIALRARDSVVARDYFLEALKKQPGDVVTRQVLASIAEKTDPVEALRW